MSLNTVAVIGLGYIGLPTAAALATRGVHVVGVDINANTVKSVNRGEVPFVEPDLEVAVSGAVAMGRLVATVDMPAADAYVVAVPTPFKEGFAADLSYVESVASALAPRLRGGEIVILESTSPPGTTEHMGKWIMEARPDLALAGTETGRPEISLAHCPERVLPGRVMIEIVMNDRIIGGLTPACAERAAELYRTFCVGELVLTDTRTAELTKLVENAYRDVNIAFANELSAICGHLNVDVWDVIQMANHHPRVNILQPGPGVGGHCIAVDPWFIVAAAPQQSRLIRIARQVNDDKPLQVIDQVVSAVIDIPLPRIACLGLAFKADIDDLRESPAVRIVTHLARLLPEAVLECIEPHVDTLPQELDVLGHVVLGNDLAVAVQHADVVLLLVDHDEFRGVDRSLLINKRIVDTRGLWRDRRMSLRSLAERAEGVNEGRWQGTVIDSARDEAMS